MTSIPPAGTTLASAAHKSNPADSGDQRVGIVALELRSFTWSMIGRLCEAVECSTTLTKASDENTGMVDADAVEHGRLFSHPLVCPA
jgi:hypothetical protein